MTDLEYIQGEAALTTLSGQQMVKRYGAETDKWPTGHWRNLLDRAKQLTVVPPPPLPPLPVFGSALTAWVATIFGGLWVGEGHLPASTGKVLPATPANANAAILAATDGQIVELGDGDYTNFSIANRIHNPANPVTIRKAQGATVKIATGGVANHAWYMTNSQGFKLVDLPLIGAKGCSIKLETHVKDIEINRCTMTGYGQGIAGHGVLTSFECERITLWDCATFNGGDHGIYLGSQGQPVGTAAFGVKGLLVVNHLSYDNHKGAGNASGDSAGFGIQLGDSVVHGRVINATCDNNGLSALYSGGMNLYTQGSVTGDKGEDVEFINCIVTNSHGWGITCPGVTPSKATNHITRCLEFNNSAGGINGASMMTVVAPNFHGDPGYRNRAAKDFHPSKTGAAFNMGDPTWTPSTDAEGAPRVTPDLGALIAV